jgi:hypothetical protein
MGEPKLGSTPFEQCAKRCINTYQRLRAQHSDLRAAAQSFPEGYCLPAFDDGGRFMGVVRSDGSRRLTACESSVRIDHKEWR